MTFHIKNVPYEPWHISNWEWWNLDDTVTSLNRKPIYRLVIGLVVFSTETGYWCNNLSVSVTVMYQRTGSCSRWWMWPTKSSPGLLLLSYTTISPPEHNTRFFPLNLEKEKSRALPPIPFLQRLEVQAGANTTEQQVHISGMGFTDYAALITFPRRWRHLRHRAKDDVLCEYTD